MTLRLTVDTEPWRANVDHVRRHCPGLVPVVKGNGYGFGRAELAVIAAGFADTMAVGTVHELDHVPAGVTPVVLTPSRRPPTGLTPIVTVGSVQHVRALHGWRGRVLVKLVSSVHRFGATLEELGEVTAAARTAGLDIVGFSIHPPVVGSDDEHLDDIAPWLDVLDVDDEVWVSHLSPSAFQDLRDAWPERRFRIRVGTRLWHGDKDALHLDADVLDARPVRAGEQVGYRQHAAPVDGQLLVIGAGTSHGVHPLADGRSPFHFARRRLALLEPPHMHTSMVVVPAGQPGPREGEHVDVQRPLISSYPDEVRWR
ncbi:MAG: alanine racemase [Ilumatobacteraceae bacterium]